MIGLFLIKPALRFSIRNLLYFISIIINNDDKKKFETNF